MAGTSNYNLPKPDDRTEDKQTLYEALVAVAVALDMIDALLKGLSDGLTGKSSTGHGHAIEDVDGLTLALAGKMAADASFSLASLSDVDILGEIPSGYLLAYAVDKWQAMSAAALLGEHGHAIEQITGLGTALNARLEKANNLSDIPNAATARTNLGLATVGQSEAEAGTSTTVRAWTAERIKQAITALAPSPATVSQVEAEAGSAATVRSWTAQRVRQAVAAYAAALSHNHSASDITSGVLPVARGGTGETTEAGMRGVFTGTGQGNTNFPIGSLVSVIDNNSTEPARNASVTVRLGTGQNASRTYFLNATGGGNLSGTWRSRGFTTFGIAQRVA